MQARCLSLIDCRAIVCALKHAAYANNRTRTGASVAVALHGKPAGDLPPAHDRTDLLRMPETALTWPNLGAVFYV